MPNVVSPPHLSLAAPAKINLFLHITARRSDGYHNLQTVFRLLDWGDTLDFYVTEQTFNPTDGLTASNCPITIACDTPVTAEMADNLIFKAANALLSWIKTAQANNQPPFATLGAGLPTLPIIAIELHKVLPTGAGLGGGSSNAATTLIALNQLWQLGLSTKQLMAIGAKLGADVPIFLLGQDAIGEGIGDKLTPFAIALPRQYYLLLNPSHQNPKAHASTQQLFLHPDLCRNIAPLSLAQILQDQQQYLTQLNAPYRNVFEPVLCKLVPEVQTALTYLRTLEALTQSTARLTGSGSSLFLPIAEQHLDAVTYHLQQVQAPPCQAILTQSRPIQSGIASLCPA